MNRLLIAVALMTTGIPAVRAQEPDLNVNSRYVIESIEVTPKEKLDKLPSDLRDDITKLVGTKVDNEKLSELARRIRAELKVRHAVPKVSKGDQPDHVKVVFETWDRRVETNGTVSKFRYHSQQGFSGVGEISTTLGENRGNRVSFGLADDGDDLIERFAGYKVGYKRQRLGSSRFQLAFDFESYHEQWNVHTENELRLHTDVPGIYRTRMNFQPVLTVVLTDGLMLDVGTSFQRFQTQYPAARTEASDSVITSLRYHRDWSGSGDDRHNLAAGYSLHAATKLLDTDYVYNRHEWDLHYGFKRGRNSLGLSFESGVIGGRAPLYERFVAGNSYYLRGWNKYDIAPIGGDRAALGKVDYGYRYFQLFYDNGAVWNQGEAINVRHSLGVGVKVKLFSLAVAFPIKTGHTEAVVMAGFLF